MIFPVTGAVSEDCSEQRSAETQAAIPEEETVVTYTLPNFENSYKEIDLVPVKVFTLISQYYIASLYRSVVELKV